MSEKLVKVAKNDEVLEVHPTALDQHKALGWTEVAADTAPTVDAVEPDGENKSPSKSSR